MKKYISISQEELLKETAHFKRWSGPVVTKIFRDSNTDPVPLGSGGFLKYKERLFLVTNEHVVHSVTKDDRKDNILITYKDRYGIDYKARIIKDEEDAHNDLAAFEISLNSAELMKNHWFLDETYIETEVSNYLERSNIVFLHGYPWEGTEIDSENKTVTLTSLPYTTFVEKYEEYPGIIVLYTEENGISEFGEMVPLPSFFGMSGSLVYGYYRNEMIPYKIIGILTNWEINTQRLDVYPIHNVINFLEAKFF
jgi:hypothetical protein